MSKAKVFLLLFPLSLLLEILSCENIVLGDAAATLELRGDIAATLSTGSLEDFVEFLDPLWNHYFRTYCSVTINIP